jgi:hypothetical protein
MLSPPFPAVMSADRLDANGITWSLGPHSGWVNQAQAVQERLALFSERVTGEVVQEWIAPVIASVSNSGQRKKRRRRSRH